MQRSQRSQDNIVKIFGYVLSLVFVYILKLIKHKFGYLIYGRIQAFLRNCKFGDDNCHLNSCRVEFSGYMVLPIGYKLEIVHFNPWNSHFDKVYQFDNIISTTVEFVQ